jgi:poly(A) polymerase
MIDRDKALKRLREAAWLQTPGVRKIFDVLGGVQGETRAVGGIVRDSLLGCLDARGEVDFATVLTPEEVIARAQTAGIKSVPTGIEFGTVTLVVNGEGFEVTTLRRDVETDGRWAKVEFGQSWEADASRRDFTLNALYCGADGGLFDPLAGLNDCLSRRVRFIGDAAKRIEEDRLRVYRFFRFSASHGEQRFDADGLKAVTAAAGNLGDLSAERVGHEMMRMLALPRIVTTITMMAECGVLLRRDALLARLQRYEELETSPSAEVRLALIAGDIPLKVQQERWRLSNATVRHVTLLVAAAELLAKEQVLRAAYKFADYVRPAVALAAVTHDLDAQWINTTSRALDVAAISPLPVTGQDLLDLGMPAGKGLGQTLSLLEEAWIDSSFSLTRAQLLKCASEN